jgi:hypothetical protein
MGSSSGNLFPVLASDICLLANAPKPEKRGPISDGGENEGVYITKSKTRTDGSST